MTEQLNKAKLWRAIENGDDALAVKLMKQCGESVNSLCNESGNTLMHLAACSGSSATIIKALLKLGLSVNITNDKGQQPLHVACA